MIWVSRRVRRKRGGGFRLDLSREERDLLRTLPGQLRAVLGSDDPALERLFPPAYAADPDRDADYQALMHDELRRHRETSLDVMEATVDRSELSEEELSRWMGAVNDLRLVLGTRLDVTEESYGEQLDPDDPRAAGLALYHYLSMLLEEIVQALAAGVDDRGTGAEPPDVD